MHTLVSILDTVVRFHFKSIYDYLPTVSNDRCVAPPDRLFTVAAECFSEKKGFPRAKWRAVAMGGTGIEKQRLSALAEPPGYCTRPIAMENASAVQQQLPLQRGAESSARNPAAAKCVEGRGDALFVLAALVWCGR